MNLDSRKEEVLLVGIFFQIKKTVARNTRQGVWLYWEGANMVNTFHKTNSNKS